MPHMAGHSGDSPEVQWADHDIQNIGISATAPAGTEVDEVLQLEPLAKNGGLERDEVAYPAFMYRSFSVSGGQAELGLGINFNDDGEFPEQAAGNVQNPQTQGELTFVNYENQGLLDSVTLHPKGETRGNTTYAERDFDFRDYAGTGPYVDSTDELSLHVECNNITGNDQNIGVVYSIGWVVEQAPEGVPDFARPFGDD